MDNQAQRSKLSEAIDKLEESSGSLRVAIIMKVFRAALQARPEGSDVSDIAEIFEDFLTTHLTSLHMHESENKE